MRGLHRIFRNLTFPLQTIYLTLLSFVHHSPTPILIDYSKGFHTRNVKVQKAIIPSLRNFHV